jgi:glutathione S-transferase
MAQPTTPVEIYWLSGSPFAWRVLLAAEMKGIPYESRLLEASKGEHKSPEFLAINPLGRVPALREGAFTLHESLAILVYLDRKQPEPPLFGRTAEEAGRIFEAISEGVCDLEPSATRLVRAMFFAQPIGADELERQRGLMQRGLERLETRAAGSAWIAGTETISGADIMAYPPLKLLLRVSARPEAAAFDLGLGGFETRFPAIAGWTHRVEQLPFYGRTYPPHWRQG